MLSSKSGSGSSEFAPKKSSSNLFSRRLSCRGSHILSDIDFKSIKLTERRPSNATRAPEKPIDRISEMQQQKEHVSEELYRAKEALAAMEEERDRATNELREMKRATHEANMKLGEELSRELHDKKKTIECLKLELEKAKGFQSKLIQQDALIEKMKMELSSEKDSQGSLLRLVSESTVRIKELEAKVEKERDSAAKITNSFAMQTKQLEETKILLEEAKLEIASLNERVETLENLAAKQGHSGESQSCASGKDSKKEGGEGVQSKKVKDLIEEMGVLKNEVKLATEGEEKTRKAMDDLALALKEVATEANQAKEELNSTQVELEQVKKEVERLKLQVKSSEDKYKGMLSEVKKEAEIFKNNSERLRIEAEESLLAWNGKEIGFVNCIKQAEDEKSAAIHENNKLMELLTVAEGKQRLAREESHKLRDILKQALNEASAAKEASRIAIDENSQLKDGLRERDDALEFLSQENERLSVSEAAAYENIKELKRLLCVSSVHDLQAEDKDFDELLRMIKPAAKGQKQNKRLGKSFSFDLKALGVY
ncbi:hypothetical protein RJ641_009990 [Dillenia turbinata]|uniref:Uncharacterized protein n=1 Tax=Dillenia turbinata TaxID=194707 RepID=A0AAN8Z608_9MAGN